MQQAWHRDGYTVDTDPARLDLATVHGYLAQSYWAHGIPVEVVRRAIEHSINFGVYEAAAGTQVGFGRVITDRATFGYLADVFVLDAHRGRGLAKFLMECVDAHADLQGFRRWVLLTRDAHGLYRQFGYQAVASPERYMERWTPNIYAAGAAPAAASASSTASPAAAPERGEPLR